MSVQAGYLPPVYGFTGRGAVRQQATYLAAVQRGYLLGYEELTSFFAAALERRRREEA